MTEPEKRERTKVMSVSVPARKEAEFNEALTILKRHHADPFIQVSPLIVETIINAAQQLRQAEQESAQHLA